MTVFFVPGWDTITPNDVQAFNTIAEADAFRNRRNEGIAMGNAFTTREEGTAYLAHLSATATQYGFQSLTPAQREAILLQAETSGTTPPFPTVLPAPSMEQTAIAAGYNTGMAARPQARRAAAQLDSTFTTLPAWTAAQITANIDNMVRNR